MSILLYLSLATLISSSYVGLLYAFDFYGVDRDDPRSIKRRLLGAVINNIISIACTYAVLCKVSKLILFSYQLLYQSFVPLIILEIKYLNIWGDSLGLSFHLIYKALIYFH